MRQASVAILLMAALVAGCTSSGSPEAQSAPDPQAFDDVEVTDTTGAIRGVVVSEAVVPLAGATISLTGATTSPNQTTDEQGAFVFNGLEPGTYFLTAELKGFTAVQQSTEVVAGDKEPPVTKIMMLADAASQPFTEIYQWNGFLQCGAWAVAVTTNPCAFTGSDNVHSFPWGPAGRVPDAFQAEAIWSGTQPLGNWLSFSAHDPNSPTGTGSCYGVNSQSPAILNKTQAEIMDCYSEDATEVILKIFPGATPGTPPTPTILLQQKYDIYMQYFFGFVPRAGYSLAVDGPCGTPEQCA